jgi:hypothetical protein
MSAGITRKNGYAATPSQRPSTLTFFNLAFAATQAGEVNLVNGTLDQIFRIALPTIGVVGMIGTLGNNGTGAGRDIRFAIEDTGADALSPSYLGTGPTNASPATTALALQAAVRALGSSVGPNSVDLTGALVTAFTL